MAARRKKAAAPFTWARSVVGTEGAPLIIADPAVYQRRTGEEGDGPVDYVDVCEFGSDNVIFLDTEGGGAADVGWNDDDAVVILATSEFDDEPKKFARLVTAIEAAKYPEYLVGELALAGGFVIADGLTSGADLSGALPTKPGAFGDRWYLPRAPGLYTVVEGHLDDDGEARWCRITPSGKKTYRRRPPEPEVDPVQAVLERISFANPIAEANALESALELVDLGRADLALDVCAKVSDARRVLASWTRILALAAQQDRSAQKEAMVLAESWLAPADSAVATNQLLPRSHLLRAIDAAVALGGDATLGAMRVKVVAAPEPDVFVPGTGDFF